MSKDWSMRQIWDEQHLEWLWEHNVQVGSWSQLRDRKKILEIQKLSWGCSDHSQREHCSFLYSIWIIPICWCAKLWHYPNILIVLPPINPSKKWLRKNSSFKLSIWIISIHWCAKMWQYTNIHVVFAPPSTPPGSEDFAWHHITWFLPTIGDQAHQICSIYISIFQLSGSLCHNIITN